MFRIKFFEEEEEEKGDEMVEMDKLLIWEAFGRLRRVLRLHMVVFLLAMRENLRMKVPA